MQVLDGAGLIEELQAGEEQPPGCTRGDGPGLDGTGIALGTSGHLR